MHGCAIWNGLRVAMLALHPASHRKGRGAGAEISAVAVRAVSISLRFAVG